MRALFSLVVVLICLGFSFLTNKEPGSATEPVPEQTTHHNEALVSASIDEERLLQMLKSIKTLPNWQLSGKPQYAEGDDLFILINGGAEIYLEYGFENAVLANFKDSNEQSIIVEIYEMSSSESAYGMYTFKTDKEATVLKIGDEAKLSGYYLNLWKNNYVITLTSAEPDADNAASLKNAATKLSETIDSKADKPELIARLTKAFATVEKPLVSKYLRGNIALSAQQFSSPDLLVIKEGAMADFGDIKVFVFKYEDPEKARDQFDQVASKLATGKKFKVITNDKANFGYEDNDANYSVFNLNQNYVTTIQTAATNKSSRRFKAIQKAAL